MVRILLLGPIAMPDQIESSGCREARCDTAHSARIAARCRVKTWCREGPSQSAGRMVSSQARPLSLLRVAVRLSEQLHTQIHPNPCRQAEDQHKRKEPRYLRDLDAALHSLRPRRARPFAWLPNSAASCVPIIQTTAYEVHRVIALSRIRDLRCPYMCDPRQKCALN